MFNLSKKTWVIIGIIVLFILVLGASAYSSYKAGKIQSGADQPIVSLGAGYGYGYGGEPRLHYQFELSRAVDSSGYRNDGTITNVKTEVNFNLGDSSYFPPVDAGNSSSLRPDWITLAAWIKPSSSSKQQDQIVTQEDYGYRFSYKSNGIHLLLKDPDANQRNQWGEIYSEASNIVESGKWNYVAATYGPDRTIKIYVNGKLKKVSNKFTGGDGKITYLGKGSTTIAFAGANPSQWRTGFKGTIDEIKIFGRALSADEIKTEYKRMIGYFNK